MSAAHPVGPAGPGHRPSVPVRTVTLGLAGRHPLAPATFRRARATLDQARVCLEELGHEVQTVRLSTRPVLDDLRDWSMAARSDYVGELAENVRGIGLNLCSIGMAGTRARPDDIAWLGEVLIRHDPLSASVQLASPEAGVDAGRCVAAAEVVLSLSGQTPESFGNFRFAGVAMVQPGCPFFPAAYHTGARTSVSVGLQGASLVRQALAPGLAADEITDRVRRALSGHARPIVDRLSKLAAELDVEFGGIDLSPAPLGEDSIAAAFERCGIGSFGSPGTLAVAAAITEGIRTTGLPTCGYNGLMLPVLEDVVLGQRWAQGQLDLDKLLCYSAVCGTGLDAIPLPGDVSVAALARVLSDVAALATRLRKPLSGRLMPVAGTPAGADTAFRSPYITNTSVRGLLGAPAPM